jgi:hypothetical protein
MTKVLLLCPTGRDRRELAHVAGDTEFVLHDYATLALEDMLIEHRQAADVRDPLAECDALAARYAGADLDAVISSDDYPGSTIAAIVAQRLGLPGPAPAANLLCQHKHACREAQRRLAPETTPAFALVDTVGPFKPPSGIELPAFVKPIKSFFSIGAQRIEAWSDIEPIRARWARLGNFFAPFDRLLGAFTLDAVGTRRLMVEQLLRGVQVTVEGYAFGGEIEIIGVVDSLMFPGTIVFQRFEYPSSLPARVQQRMHDIALRLMRGVGFDNGMFNIEMMYDPDSDALSVIEINPRMASQFADLYEQVDGVNGYAIMLDIALGRAPRMRRRAGRHPMAASCVLRTFADQEILAQPSAEEVAKLAERHPGLRVEATGTVGGRLSDVMQDGNSFRYGLIHLGGRDRQDILQSLQECERHLTFGLRPAPVAPTRSAVNDAVGNG